MGRPKERTPAMRDRVVQVAVAMLEHDGIGALTARRVAAAAGTSVPALYELFGDKGGLLRQVFVEGFAMLSRRFDTLPETLDPLADLLAALRTVRSFVRDHPVITDVMFSRPFADVELGPADEAAGRAVRELIVGRVRRCREARVLRGDDADVAQVLLALVQGMAAQENAGWLGTSRTSRDRRWELAFAAILAGLHPNAKAVPSSP